MLSKLIVVDGDAVVVGFVVHVVVEVVLVVVDPVVVIVVIEVAVVAGVDVANIRLLKFTNFKSTKLKISLCLTLISIGKEETRKVKQQTHFAAVTIISTLSPLADY